MKIANTKNSLQGHIWPSKKMLKEIMLQRRKYELELYKLFAGDSAFKVSWRQSIWRMSRYTSLVRCYMAEEEIKLNWNINQCRIIEIK